MKATRDQTPDELANRDPISGAPGAHPVGVGVGAAGGGAAGGAIGATAGPVGAVVGAAVGAVAGGLAGKAVAERIDPTVEDAYWRANYLNRPYVETGIYYPEYEPAYRYGWEAVGRYPGRQSPQDITVFKSLGLGVEDVAVAVKVVELARQNGVGRDLPV